MATTVKRDPFARGEYKRFCQGQKGQWGSTCDWCGQMPDRVYSYVWWADDKPEPMHDSGHWFCNLDCFRTYNEVGGI